MYMFEFLEEELGVPWLCFITGLLFKLSLLSLFDCFSFVLHSLTSLIINCLSLLFWAQGRPNKKWGTQRNLYPGGPCKILLSFSLLFSLIILSPEGNRGRTRKGMKFWIERLSINLAEKIGFRRPWFYFWVNNLSIHWVRGHQTMVHKLYMVHHLGFFVFFGGGLMPAACKSFWARDAVVTMPDP